MNKAYFGHNDKIPNNPHKKHPSHVGAANTICSKRIKAAFTVVNKVDPRFVHLAVSSLIDEFIHAMDPTYASYKRDGKNGLRAYWIQEKTNLADSLLQVADKRMNRAHNKVLKKAYSKLRPSGLKHVEASVPAIADVISKYVS